MATVVPIDCTTTEGVLRIVKMMLPKRCGVSLSDEDMCALIEAGDTPVLGAASVFDVLASQAAGSTNIRIGSTSVEASSLCAKFRGLYDRVMAKGLPGCPQNQIPTAGNCMPVWTGKEVCNDLYPGRFSDPKCGVCAPSPCGCK